MKTDNRKKGIKIDNISPIPTGVVTSPHPCKFKLSHQPTYPQISKNINKLIKNNRIALNQSKRDLFYLHSLYMKGWLLSR